MKRIVIPKYEIWFIQAKDLKQVREHPLLINIGCLIEYLKELYIIGKF